MARNADIRLRRSAVKGNVPTIEQLNLGELAVNTADGKLFLKKVYDGIEQIVEVGAYSGTGISSTFNTYAYTSAGNLSTVSGLDDAGNFLTYDLSTPSRIQVHLNGVLLHQGIDYTANDGTSIVFAEPIGAGQVVQVSAYNSTGASFDNDFILDDNYSFTVGTNEETKFYHNSTDTYIKHYGYNDGKLKLTYRDSDRIDIDQWGVNIYGNFRLNGDPVVVLTDVINQINAQVDKTFVNNLNIDASSVAYWHDSADFLATNVQEALDILQDRKLSVDALTSSVTFYPTTAIEAGQPKLVTSLDDPEFNATATDVNTGIIDSDNKFIITLYSEKGVLAGSTGSINIHTVGNVRRHAPDGTGSADFYFEVYKVDSDNNELLMGTSSYTKTVSEDTYSEFFADAVIQSTLFGGGDRVAFKYYGRNKTANLTSYDFQFGGDQPVRSHFPVPLSVIPVEAKFADDIFTTPANFSGILGSGDTNVQLALQTIDGITTSVIPEGTNQYFTVDRARSSIVGGTGILYDSASGIISVNDSIATKNYAESFTQLYTDSAVAVATINLQQYADTAATNALTDSKAYTDSAVSVGIASANTFTQTYADSQINVAITALQAHVDSNDSFVLQQSKIYTDSATNISIQLSNAYADSAINIAIANLVDGAPQVLDTLNEIATAIGNDSDFIGTIQNWINQKLDKTATTDDVTEGVLNKYYTDTRARNALSGTNGIVYDPLTGEFRLDSNASFDTITATTFVGDLDGTANNALLLGGKDSDYYRINVYNSAGTLVN